MSSVNFEDWTAFGVKAANVAVLGTLGFAEGTVPEGFAVPFYFYDEFMKANGLDDDVDQMLANEEFQTDFDVQDDMLDDLRDDIKDADSPQWIIDALTDMHETYPVGQSLRYRSSTNNEDLPEFNGAGLYDSKTQDPDETEEDGIDKSLKGVFASLWTFRAFTEREFHRIEHTAAAMGVLVHPNYSDELANGVAVSFDPIADRNSRYYVNTQIEEDLVTNPEAHSVPEEILLYQDGTYIVHGTSNQAPPGQLLLSNDQFVQLSRHLTTIHDHFESLYDPDTDEKFAMEIEFKITSDNILAIKQARPWVFGQDSSDSLQALRISDAEADEGANVDLTVTMNKATTNSVTVQYDTSDGTATGSDYTAATGQTLTFAPGETEKTITIVTADDSDAEQDETFQVTLSNPSANAELSYSRTATGTIADNDTPALADDATLSALTLTGDTTAALTPVFDPTTTTYTADVGNAVATMTIAGTANHAGASVAVVETNGTSTPDTAQIDLDYGDNVVSIVVTAEDQSSTSTYQVTVARAFAWQTTLTVGERLTAIPQASGYTTWGEDMGSLSTEQIQMNGTRYRVLSLMRYAGGLYLNISRATPRRLHAHRRRTRIPGQRKRRAADPSSRTLLVGCQRHQLGGRRLHRHQHHTHSRLREPPNKATGATHRPIQNNTRKPRWTYPVHLQAGLHRRCPHQLQNTEESCLSGHQRNRQESQARRGRLRHELDDHGETEFQQCHSNSTSRHAGLRRRGRHLHQRRQDAVQHHGVHHKWTITAVRHWTGRPTYHQQAEPILNNRDPKQKTEVETTCSTPKS